MRWPYCNHDWNGQEVEIPDVSVQASFMGGGFGRISLYACKACLDEHVALSEIDRALRIESLKQRMASGGEG